MMRVLPGMLAGKNGPLHSPLGHPPGQPSIGPGVRYGTLTMLANGLPVIPTPLIMMAMVSSPATAGV
jgi:hypothetical protein